MNKKTIKKLRRKFTLTALISFVSVMLLMSVTIYVGNIITTISQVVKTLNYLTENNGEINISETDKSEAEDFARTQREDDPFIITVMEDMFGTGIDSADFLHSVRFMSAYYDNSAGSADIIENHIAMVDRNEFEEMTKEAVDGGNKNGAIGNYIYQLDNRGEKTLVVFVDTSVQSANVRRIGNIMLVILIAGSILAYVIVRILSGRMIQPEIRAAEQQKQFITNASHELKTPLAVIRANTELEMMMHGEDEWNQSTMNQVDRMTGLIGDLVKIAKAEENEGDVELSEVDASKAANEVADTFEPVARQSGKTLTKEIDENVTIRANKEQISQLVTLLVDNAIKYCDENGEVKICLSQKGRGIRLAVSNSFEEGKGIDYSKFFERFYRQDESHNIDKGGYGIGLSIAEGIVHKYRGSIDVSWKDGVISFNCALKGEK